MNLLKLLISRRDNLQALFDAEIKKENEAKEEKLRLQGEFRLLQDLINKANKKKAGEDGRV